MRTICIQRRSVCAYNTYIQYTAVERIDKLMSSPETVGEGGESSDSDVYMSADEGLGNSRGDEKGGPLRRRERETENINGTHQSHPSDKESQRREEGNGEGEEGQEEVKKSSGSESIGERAGRENGVEEGEGEGGTMVEGEDVGKQSVRVEHDTSELKEQLPVDLVESREVKGEGGGESVREEEGEKEAGDKAEKKEEVEKVEEEEGQGCGEKEGAESEPKEPPQSSRQEETKEVELPAKAPPRPGGDAGDETPIPPPRRKRKKKLQKNPSLENLEKVPDDTQLHRSMTVGSVDMSRERAPSNPRSPLSPTSPLLLPEGERPGRATGGSKGGREKEERKREGKEKEGKTGGQLELRAGGWKGKQWRGEKSDKPRSPVASVSRKMRKEEGAGGARRGSSARAPFISIEPNTSLELTEEMMLGGSEVVTTDTLLAKASGSDKHEMGIIIDSDDESLDGDGPFGSQELTDHGEQEADGEGEVEGEEEEGGEKGEVGGDAGVSQTLGESEERDEKEKTPLAVEEKGEEEKGKEKEEEQTKGRKNRAASPSDNQILQMTIVKNLDTGDSFPLSAADEKIPSGDPLSEHLIKRRAMEGHIDEGSGEDSHQRKKPLRRKLKQFLGKKRHKQHTEGAAAVHESEGIPPVPGSHDPDQSIKYKPSSHNKGPYEFDKVRLKQDLTGHHLGAVWVMEFSICGRLLAVAGQDSIVRVWVLRNAAQFFHELQAKYQRFGVHSSGESLAEKASMASTCSSDEDDASATKGPFLELPICAYYGHTADILDLSWSKNFFLLSSSMDKTVRLWHISRKECLCCFQHVDFVTAIAFHPRDDRYFLSGSLDGKLRLWNIPDKRVALWNEIEGVGSHLITAANFCMNGKLAVAGTYDGRCIFYETEHLKYHTQIHVRSRHGKNRGRKISGIEPLPGEDKILVTSNDSRLRLYNLKDHSLSCKYKGGLNTSSQIRATFSRDGLSIISGSEDNFIYVWKTHHDVSKLSSARRDRNEFYESFTTHHAPVTAAVFAPVPGITVDEGLKEVGQMIVAADYQGCIKVYVNTEKL